MGAKFIKLPLKPVKIAITRNGRDGTANNHTEKAEVLKKYFCSLFGKRPDAVLRSDNNDVEILSITVTKEDVKTTATHLK